MKCCQGSRVPPLRWHFSFVCMRSTSNNELSSPLQSVHNPYESLGGSIVNGHQNGPGQVWNENWSSLNLTWTAIRVDWDTLNFYSLVPRLLQAMPAQLMPWSLIRFLIRILRTTHSDSASLSRWLLAAILMEVSSWRTTGLMSSSSMEFSQMWKLLLQLNLRYHFIDMLIQVTPFTKALYPPLSYPLVFSLLDNWPPHQS